MMKAKNLLRDYNYGGEDREMNNCYEKFIRNRNSLFIKNFDKISSMCRTCYDYEKCLRITKEKVQKAIKLGFIKIL